MASCPLGFGSPGGGGAQLTPYHCPLCRGLLHEPVSTPCSHTFCSFCIRRARDCPVCGADIDSTQPDTALGETIQKLLVGHARILAKASGMDPSGPAGCPATASTTATAPIAKVPTPSVPPSGTTAAPAAPLDLPSLLLQLSLQSLAGGNPEAAFARLELCADNLCSSSESESKSGTPSKRAISSTIQSGAGASGAESPAGGAPTAPAPPGSQAPAPRDASSEGPPSSAPPHPATSEVIGQLPSSPGATTAAADAPAGPAPPTAAAMSRRLAAARTSPETASRLGAVLGCQADCCRRLGDGAAAQALYGASLACLDPWVGRSRDVDQVSGAPPAALQVVLSFLVRIFPPTVAMP